MNGINNNNEEIEVDSEKLLKYLKSTKEKEKEVYLNRLKMEKVDEENVTSPKFYKNLIDNKIKKMKEEIKEENELILENNRLNKEKKVDNYYKNLERKVKLNLKMYKLLQNHFYYDEFNNTRNSIYLGMCFPVGVVLYFLTYNHGSPVKNIMINFSVGVSVVSIYYFFKRDLDAILLKGNSPLTDEIKNIKNELAVYNPLNNSYIEDDNERS